MNYLEEYEAKNCKHMALCHKIHLKRRIEGINYFYMRFN